MEKEAVNKKIEEEYIVSENMKKLWKKELELLAELDRVCKKHNIKYFADSGTLLGAVRHKGFIPWDDDIDVAMLRQDYEKLKQLSSSEFKSPYFLQSAYTDKAYFRGHIQLRNSNTAAIIPSEGNKVQFNQGIFLDIFPIDEISSNYFERNIKFFCIKFYSKIFKIMCVKDDINTPKIKKIIRTIIRKIFKMKNFVGLYKRFERCCSNAKFKSNTVDKISFILNRNGYRFIPKDYYLESVEVDFEDTKVPIPKEYDKILKMLYGENYMTPLKVSTTHGKLIINTERSYKEILRG